MNTDNYCGAVVSKSVCPCPCVQRCFFYRLFAVAFAPVRSLNSQPDRSRGTEVAGCSTGRCNIKHIYDLARYLPPSAGLVLDLVGKFKKSCFVRLKLLFLKWLPFLFLLSLSLAFAERHKTVSHHLDIVPQ